MFSRLMSINNHLYWLITTYTGPPKKESSLNSISFRGKKIQPEQKRTKSISSRLSDEEFEIFNQLCKETGLEGGVYIRQDLRKDTIYSA